MNIIVVGAGALGSVLATTLARAGEDVSLLMRPDRAPEAGAARLTIVRDPPAAEQWAIVPVVTMIAEPPDLVVLAVPTAAMPDALAAIAPVCGAAPALVLATGPQGDEAAIETLGADRVIRGVALMTAVMERPAQARVAGAQQVLLGASSATLDALITRLVEACDGSPQASRVPDVTGCRWSAALVALARGVTALADQPTAALGDDRRLSSVARNMIREATETLATAGVTLAPLPALDSARLARLHAVPGIFAGRAWRNLDLSVDAADALPPPLAATLRARRRAEMPAIAASVLALAGAHHVAAPTIERLALLAAKGAPIAPDALARAIARGK